MTFAHHEKLSQGGGYGGPPPGGTPPGGSPPGGSPPGGYGPPGGGPPGGYGGPPGGYGGPPGGGYGGPPGGGYGGPPAGGGPPGYGQPPPGYGGGYPPPPGGPSGYGGAQPGPAAEIKKQATTWLIVSAVSFFFCGGVNCFGLIGGVLCFLAMQAADQNNVPDAEAKLKWGKIVTIAGGAIALVSLILGVIYYVFIMAAAFASS